MDALALLPLDEYGKLKTVFKSRLGKALNSNDLQKAVNEAREARKEAGRQASKTAGKKRKRLVRELFPDAPVSHGLVVPLGYQLSPNGLTREVLMIEGLGTREALAPSPIFIAGRLRGRKPRPPAPGARLPPDGLAGPRGPKGLPVGKDAAATRRLPVRPDRPGGPLAGSVRIRREDLERLEQLLATQGDPYA